MNAMHEADIRAIVAETLAEQHRLYRDDIDVVVLKTIATILTSFGIEEEDRKEMRADFQHLRRWRKSVEQAQSYTFKAVITVIVTGLVGGVMARHQGDAREVMSTKARMPRGTSQDVAPVVDAHFAH